MIGLSGTAVLMGLPSGQEFEDQLVGVFGDAVHKALHAITGGGCNDLGDIGVRCENLQIAMLSHDGLKAEDQSGELHRRVTVLTR